MSPAPAAMPPPSLVRARLRLLAVALATVLAAGVTARLGVWQLDRAAQKQALQRSLSERGQLPPLSLDRLARDPAAAAEQHHRLVRLQGRWRDAATVWLDNRSLNGRAGFLVLTPLLLPTGDAVLVQRGWVPRDLRDRQRLPPLPNAPGERLLLARVVPPPSQTLALGDGLQERGPIRQNLDLPAYAREIGTALRPLSLQQLEADDAAPAEPGAVRPDTAAARAAGSATMASAPDDGLLRLWPAPATDVGKHHGYAFQWFALCALTIGLFLWYQIIRPRRHARS